MNICRICHNSKNNREYHLREMMFGTRDRFAYFKCSNCGCIQIKEIPKNLSKYYPSNYYSLKSKGKKDYLKSVIRIISRMIIFGAPPQFLGRQEISCWIKKAKINLDSKILDVGSGSGGLLKKFAARGFKHLIGVDPYIKNDILYPNGVRIFKKDLSSLKGKYDFIMLHHSLEHMREPYQVLADIYRLLRPEGRALIRIPVASSFAWEKYQTNWVQLDAPRHLFIYAPKSIKILAKKSALKLFDIVYDSSDFQFWGSEQYQKGIPLDSEKSYGVNPHLSIFSRKDIKKFREKAKVLNREGKGDQAAFWFIKK